MKSACQGSPDKIDKDPCQKREYCWRYYLYRTHPNDWSIHRACITDEYKFFIGLNESCEADE